MLILEACKRFEWAGRDDSAEVKHNCAYNHLSSLKSGPIMTAESPSGRMGNVPGVTFCQVPAVHQRLRTKNEKHRGWVDDP
jgi:hypothetical protein